MQDLEIDFTKDDAGNPHGGSAYGVGINVIFQAGPIQGGKQNGATVEDVIELAIRRLKFFQDSKFRCEENEVAIAHLELAQSALETRTRDRVRRGVEGTHQL